mmetsp:Transcript_14046/g.52677  ORF Transcript_14046/g.52677 Transcript_14046/m.52677 type:complete len:553 (-) Transcript_14046:271-1929(-)
MAGRGAPVLFQVLRVRGQSLVLIDGHPVGDVELGGVELGLLVVQDGFHERLGLLREVVADVVALALELLHDRLDRVEHVQVGGSSDVALVRGEAEDGDGQLLVRVLLAAELCPLERPVRQQVDAIAERNGAPRGTLTAGEDDRLDGTVDFGEGHLQSDLDGVQSELGGLPLFEGLEHQRHGAQVRAIQLLKRLDGLRVILRGRAANESEAREIDDRVDRDLAVEVEVVVDRGREIQPSGVDVDDARATSFELGDEGDVVALVAGVDVRLLQDHADGGSSAHVDARAWRVDIVVPFVVLFGGLEHAVRHGMPDALVRDELGLLDGRLVNLGRLVDDELVRQVQDHALDVLGAAAEPVLEAHHERAGILGLVTGQVFQHLRERAQQLQHAFLEGSLVVLALLLHEVGDDALGLAQVVHRELPDLVEPHDLRHGGENEHGVEVVALGLDHLDDLVGELLHEDQGPDEHVGLLHILAELLNGCLRAQLLQQVSHALDAHVLLLLVDFLARLRHGLLILVLEDHVHDLHLLAPVHISRHDPAVLRPGRREKALVWPS